MHSRNNSSLRRCHTAAHTYIHTYTNTHARTYIHTHAHAPPKRAEQCNLTWSSHREVWSNTPLHLRCCVAVGSTTVSPNGPANHPSCVGQETSRYISSTTPHLAAKIRHATLAETPRVTSPSHGAILICTGALLICAQVLLIITIRSTLSLHCHLDGPVPR